MIKFDSLPNYANLAEKDTYMQDNKNNLKYLIGNWKANKTVQEALYWINEVRTAKLKISERLITVLCPAFIHLPLFHTNLPDLMLGCQNISPYGDGAYTGEISARMLTSLVKYVILGHSERERNFQETSAAVSLKAIQALDNRLIPLIAVNKHNLRQRITALDRKIITQSVLIYEPPEAISVQVGPIGKGESAPLEEVIEQSAKLKQDYQPQAVIYGGSIKSENLALFLSQPAIDGVLSGSASLNASEWVKMVKIADQITVNLS